MTSPLLTNSNTYPIGADNSGIIKELIWIGIPGRKSNQHCQMNESVMSKLDNIFP